MPVAEYLQVSEVRGFGSPDYTKEVSQGRVRPGLTLKHSQVIMIVGVTFADEESLFPYVRPPLPAGEAAHLVDWATGFDLPYILPAGYLFTAFQAGHCFSQRASIVTHVDGQLGSHLGIVEAFHPIYVGQIAEWSTALIDPEALLPHIYDAQIENVGDEDMLGSLGMWGILEAVGTPPLPDVKTVKCRKCGHEHTVNVTATLVKCPECGEQTQYISVYGYRGL